MLPQTRRWSIQQCLPPKAEDRRQQEAELAARRAALEEEARQQREMMVGVMAISRLRREEAQATERGDLVTAAAKRKAADAQEDEKTRRDAIKEAQGVTNSHAAQADYAKRVVAEAQADRNDQRDRQERERSMARQESATTQRGAVTALQAELARMQGRDKDARRMMESAARERDQVNREKAKKEFINQGFDAKKAQRMADVQVKTDQVTRMLEQIGKSAGTVIADSLAKIGGGGNVSGTDPDTALLRDIRAILKQIYEVDKQNVTDLTMR